MTSLPRSGHWLRAILAHRSLSRRSAIVAGIGTLAAIPSAGRAQTQPRLSVIDGIVIDTALARLAGATVSLMGSSLQVTTGISGHFAITGLAKGPYVLVGRRIGYAPLFAPLEVASSDTVRVTLTLQVLEYTLDTVSVLAPRPASSRLDEFEQRRKLGQGSFFTQADIKERNPVVLSDMFRTLPSVTIAGTAVNRRMGLLLCPFQFFVDGVAMPTPRNMDLELPIPQDLAGIEVYSNAANAPPQFKTAGGRGDFRGGAFCGVILLWTKDGR